MPPVRTSARIERAADRLLAVHAITGPEVPVEQIAKAQGLPVLYDDLGSDVSGVLYRRNGTELIIVNQDHHEHRQRFTVAHELGHADLHEAKTYLDGSASLRFRDGLSATGTDAEEREANRFAAALLMPAAWLRERFIELVVGPDPLKEGAAIIRLSHVFNVSEQAMRLRLVNLGLIDPT
jgi:Zn-dependent peptidase ImmA (M78 family)